MAANSNSIAASKPTCSMRQHGERSIPSGNRSRLTAPRLFHGRRWAKQQTLGVRGQWSAARSSTQNVLPLAALNFQSFPSSPSRNALGTTPRSALTKRTLRVPIHPAAYPEMRGAQLSYVASKNRDSARVQPPASQIARLREFLPCWPGKNCDNQSRDNKSQTHERRPVRFRPKDTVRSLCGT